MKVSTGPYMIISGKHARIYVLGFYKSVWHLFVVMQSIVNIKQRVATTTPFLLYTQLVTIPRVEYLIASGGWAFQDGENDLCLLTMMTATRIRNRSKDQYHYHG